YPFIPLFMFMMPNDCGSALYRFIIYRLHFVYVQNYLHIFFAKIVRWLLLQYIIFFLFLLLVIYDHYLVHSLILLVTNELLCVFIILPSKNALIVDVIVNNISYVTLFILFR
ncbi:hypothetical protein ACJX0J_023499, partial [Zea mays]